jgi:hypothetical protein
MPEKRRDVLSDSSGEAIMEKTIKGACHGIQRFKNLPKPRKLICG